MEGRHDPDDALEPGRGGGRPDQGYVTQRAARNIAERHLDRYFEMVEAELNHREQQWLTSR